MKKIIVPIGGLVLLFAAWRAWGWGGVAIASGGIVMFLLLHFHRTMQVLQRTAERPVGYVASAVMLNAKLRPGLTLLHVLGMTRALGQQVSPKDEQPELFRWTDGGDSHVTGEFLNGKLVRWELVRPTPDQAPVATEVDDAAMAPEAAAPLAATAPAAPDAGADPAPSRKIGSFATAIPKKEDTP